jgi:hypothetical protein
MEKLKTFIGVLLIGTLIFGYAFVFHSFMETEIVRDAEKERREYIKFQKDSLEMEVLKTKIHNE